MEAIDKLRDLSKKLEDPYFIKEFEEGFEKFLKERDMKIYHVKTQADYDALMSELEEKGCEWRSGVKPAQLDKFKDSGKDTCVYEEDGIISFSGVEYFKKYHSNETLVEYKAKGEDMTQEEMKHNLQEVAFDISESIESFARGTLAVEADLQEAKSSAKKLIEKIDEYFETLKPKFKVGDYVTVYVNGKEKIAKIDELTENNSKAHGLWYDRTLVNIKQDYWFPSGLNEFRHARPSEIAEYEVALIFHKHGRKPFELKRGDVVYLKGYDKNIFLDSGNIYKKHNFIDGDVVFVKTAEEVNEWL